MRSYITSRVLLLSFTRHALVQKYFVFSHAFVIVFTLSISLLLLHFNISSGMNSVSDTCKLSYFMIIKLLVCNSTATIDKEDYKRLHHGERRVFIIKLKRKPGAIRSWFLKKSIYTISISFGCQIQYGIELILYHK
jgi:hypothetical protein